MRACVLVTEEVEMIFESHHWIVQILHETRYRQSELHFQLRLRTELARQTSFPRDGQLVGQHLRTQIR